VTENIPKSVLFGAAVLVTLALAYYAYSRPEYFTSQTCLAVLLLEFLLATVVMYRRLFLPVLLVAFLFAGVDLPVGSGWTAARWLFLSVGALVGSLIVVKDPRHHFSLFHALASFAVLTTLVSASVSRYPGIALLKALSLFLLFLYGGTGARIAATGRESRFVMGLLTGCEIFVGVMAALYAVGIEAMGNPNSLGAVMGYIGAPVLLWGALLRGEPLVQHRRWAVYGICMCMTLMSHARAGIAAAFLSCGLLCLALRRYKLIIKGLVVILIIVASIAIFRPGMVSSVASSVAYKSIDRQKGLVASREAPWRAAVDNIRNHFWFGAGLGTTASGEDPSKVHATFASTASVTAENGSSYLAIMAGVGVLGVPPFFLMLILLVRRVFRTVTWMLRTGSASHPAVPLAMVMVAGIVHAGFEDWMFAPGNYLCVFFWSLAFVFVDLAPSLRLSSPALAWHPGSASTRIGRIAPSS
jgi:O-antigen ligase